MSTTDQTTDGMRAFANEATERSAQGYRAGVEQIKDGMASATVGFEKTQAQVKHTMEKAMKTAEELVTFGQGNVEAFVKSGQIWAAGMQDISKQMAAAAQASLEETMSAYKAMAGVKSLKDAVELQSGLARTTLEKTVAESSRITDASMKLAEQAFAPLTARLTLAVEKFGRAV